MKLGMTRAGLMALVAQVVLLLAACPGEPKSVDVCVRFDRACDGGPCVADGGPRE